MSSALNGNDNWAVCGNTARKRANAARLNNFQWFVTGLTSLAFLSLLMFFYKCWLALTNFSESLWQLWWLDEAFWFFLFFITTAMVAVLFSPFSAIYKPVTRTASAVTDPSRAVDDQIFDLTIFSLNLDR